MTSRDQLIAHALGVKLDGPIEPMRGDAQLNPAIDDGETNPLADFLRATRQISRGTSDASHRATVAILQSNLQKMTDQRDKWARIARAWKRTAIISGIVALAYFAFIVWGH